MLPFTEAKIGIAMHGINRNREVIATSQTDQMDKPPLEDDAASIDHDISPVDV